MTNEEAIQIMENERPHCGKRITFTEEEKYEAFEMAIAALKAEPCEDAVDRKEALKAIEGKEYKFQVYEAIEKLPPVTPKPRTGKWIETLAEDACGELYSYWACSECGRSVGYNLADIKDVLEEYPYCHCGAKMERNGDK